MICKANNVTRSTFDLTTIQPKITTKYNLSNNFLTSNDKQQIKFRKKHKKLDVIFPHEKRINASLKIIAENPEIGKLKEDSRTDYQGFNESYTITKFCHNLPIFQPANVTMATIADYYKKKYDINIYVVTDEVVQAIYQLAKQLKNSTQIGIVARLEPWSDHVTPVIISKYNNELYIILLDSINFNRNIVFYLPEVYTKIIQDVNTKCHVLRLNQQRQQDSFSCINDAFVILKDSLRVPNLINRLFTSTKTVDIHYHDIENSTFGYEVHVVTLPKFLYKAVQNKQLLDNLTATDLQTNLKLTIDVYPDTEAKNLTTHLDKYNRDMTVIRTTFTERCFFNTKKVKKIWKVNTYLQVKGYLMLAKAFELIDDGSGHLNQQKAKLLVQQYVNPHLRDESLS